MSSSDDSELLEGNSGSLIKLGAVVLAVGWATGAEMPDVPSWSPLVGTVAVAGGLGVLFWSGRITDLIPDPERVYLFALRGDDTEQIALYALSPDAFEKVGVTGGTLNELTECKHRAYEATRFDPDTMTAKANWRASPAPSEIAGHEELADALSQIAEYRDVLEPEARKGRLLRLQLPGILRELDRRRLETQAETLEPHMAPSFGGEYDGIDDVIAERLPEDLRPNRATAADLEEHDEAATNGHDDLGEWELDIDTEALDPVGGEEP